MLKATLYIGLLDKDNKRPVMVDDDFVQVVRKTVGDCTVSFCKGFYTHENGTEIEEKSLRVEKLFSTKEKIKDICEDLKILLNQESIAVEYTQIESELI